MEESAQRDPNHRDPTLSSGRARVFLVLGLVVTAITLVLLLTGRTGPVTWAGLGLGLGSLLVASAQLSSLRARRKMW